MESAGISSFGRISDSPFSRGISFSLKRQNSVELLCNRCCMCFRESVNKASPPSVSIPWSCTHRPFVHMFRRPARRAAFPAVVSNSSFAPSTVRRPRPAPMGTLAPMRAFSEWTVQAGSELFSERQYIGTWEARVERPSAFTCSFVDHFVLKTDSPLTLRTAPSVPQRLLPSWIYLTS